MRPEPGQAIRPGSGRSRARSGPDSRAPHRPRWSPPVTVLIAQGESIPNRYSGAPLRGRAAFVASQQVPSSAIPGPLMQPAGGR